MKLKYIILFLIILCVIIISIQLYCKSKHKTILELLHPEWYLDVVKFPYDKFPCKVNCDDYNNKIKDGIQIMKKKKIVFCGLCINIEKQAYVMKKRFEHLGQYFDDYRVVIFENDSIDNTRKILKNICAENNKFVLIDCPDAKDCKYKIIQAKDHGVFSEKRMQKMVKFRNMLLSFIKDNFHDFDLICQVDLDITGPIDLRGLAHSFGNYNRWDAISAMGLNGITLTGSMTFYYDLIAYKDNNHDINENLLHIIPIMMKTNKRLGSDIYKVRSGFCGMELVKMYVLNANINYTPIDNKYPCEHIIFHQNMINNNFDNIYINPNMLVLVGHQGNAKYLATY